MINEDLKKTLTYLLIYNSLGQMVQREKLIFTNNSASISTKELINGVYFITVQNANHENVTKKLVISN